MPQALHTANIHLNDQREKIVIAKKLCVTRMTVQRTVERYQDLGIANDRPRSERPRSMNTFRVRTNAERTLRDN
uniref:Helix-turn-helix domain-containing protein n=1 Tax=Heterorhabditis bacteriophora TaxID=37862 RepID=A0A1I7X8X0_HETBA